MSAVDMMKPQAEHVALERLVGTWDVRSSVTEPDDHRPFTSATRQEDGRWKTFQDIEYTRKRQA